VSRYIGLDVGSVSADLAVVDDEGRVLATRYIRVYGRPHEVALEQLEELLKEFGPVDGLCTTGSGAKLIAQLLGVPFVNEIVAHSEATGRLVPAAQAVIEIGGTESKLIRLARGEDGSVRVADFAMNALCAAGTGSFLDQQASRLRVSIEEFSRMALKSEAPPRVAGRCSVFAKSDMIHLQQQGTPDYDIVAGLCYAMARNFRGTVATGRQLGAPVAFQGGVAANVGMVRALRDVLGLTEDQLVIPEHFGCMGAIGAVLHVLGQGRDCGLRDLGPLREHLAGPRAETESLPVLTGDGYRIDVGAEPPASSGERVDAYVGVDVGSISTNVVVIDGDARVIARRYLMTEGRPVEAVKKALYEVGEEVGDRVRVRGCATTGSGRYLTGAFVGADIVKNEITTHALAAATAVPDVDTIFEIGGQDAKYMSMAGGAVVDFAMNKVCAAGTGSFLEEQAERLGLRIDEEFGAAALASGRPCQLGERCTVFMESDLTCHQQRGVPRDDLVGGLCYSIVYNYLNRVVEDRKVGDVILFQGGVAFNRGVKAAFEAVLGKKVVVPPQHDIMGAIGAALIARERSTGVSRFRGFDLRDVGYELTTFECKGCANLCEIHRVSIEGLEPLHYGSRCGRFDESRPSVGGHLPDLFAEREEALLNTYGRAEPARPLGVRVGVPRAFSFFDRYPFWKAFLTEIGCEVVLSQPTNKRTGRMGCEAMAAETCFPVAVAHGHVLQLIEQGVDYVFVPSVVNLEHEIEEAAHSYACPLAQGLPYLLQASIEFGTDGARLLSPVFHFERGRPAVDAELRDMGRRLGAPARRVDRAIDEAWAALERFRGTLREVGERTLGELSEQSHAVVVVSRPYNGCDEAMNLGVPEKLRDLGVLAIPLDMLPLDLSGLGAEYSHMYWKYGQQILAAGRFMADRRNLQALYITNFRCGPDSFISKHFDRLLGKPYLTIEVDQHSADVGAVTRCEAFVDSFPSIRPTGGPPRTGREVGFSVRCGSEARRIYIPHMDDHGVAIAAVLRGWGVSAEALPMSDKESLELGRQLTTGKECYPCILTTGDMVKKTREPGFDPARSAFFMAQASGPCRFGQYHKFHRMVLDDLGYPEVPMVVLDQTHEFARQLGSFGPEFYRDLWRCIVIVDCMQKVVREVRPAEAEAGETDRAYRDTLGSLVETAQRRGDLLSEAARARRRLGAVALNGQVPRPVIGIVGEIYVRSNEFANNFLVRRLERVGAEAVLPTLQEWTSYIAHERRALRRLQRQWGALLKEWVAELVGRRDEGRVSQAFKGAIRRMPREAHTAEIVGLGSRYLDPSVKGEAILSIGRAVEYAQHGLDGVVNVAPFGCMPGSLVDGLLERFRRDHPGVPVLKLAFDGVEHTGEETQLEAFVHQARQHMASRV
jgi:predicted CoA-substrate-specific enzyme activase